VYFMGVKVARV